ncbi:MAG: pyridoxal 5'-phosphate synthase glutaminase subunit PdxT [Acidimicrobiales bacterium]
MKVGVLALQGAFARHGQCLRALGAEVLDVRQPSDLTEVDALVLPGGESTTMSMLLETSGLFDAIADRLRDGLPTLGTCAGMILLGSEILDGRGDQRCFGAIDISVRRNAFGRQIDSFEADLALSDVQGEPFRAIFIRAPFVERTGPNVEVLATVDGHPVLCRQGAVTVAAFHPELTSDARVHDLFLKEL